MVLKSGSFRLSSTRVTAFCRSSVCLLLNRCLPKFGVVDRVSARKPTNDARNFSKSGLSAFSITYAVALGLSFLGRRYYTACRNDLLFAFRSRPAKNAPQKLTKFVSQK